MNKHFEKIMDRLINWEPIIIQFTQTLGYSALGGRICYSPDKVEDILETDERLTNPDVVLDYLSRLIQRGHLSIFEHSVIPLTIDDIYERFKHDITLDDIVRGISEDFYYLFQVVGVDGNLPQTFPIIETEKEVEGLFDGIKAVLRMHFHILPHTESSILLNMRHVLEYKHKQLDNDWNKVAEWFKSIFGKFIENHYIIPDILKSIPINLDQSKLHVVRVIGHGENPTGITFILEDVSRVLTHQLVRHRLYASYSQRSQRYTKVKDGEFIIPPLEYIKLKTVRRQFVKQFESAYNNAIKAYNKMVEEGIEHNGELFKVRKEDARFIIPNGSKTTIMVTMLGDGLKNFLHERTHEHAQWEIREVACLVDDFIKGKIS